MLDKGAARTIKCKGSYGKNMVHFCVMRVILIVTNVRESKTVLDSGFHAMYSGFRIPDTLSVEIGSLIPKPRISDSTATTCWIPDSRSKSRPRINATQASQNSFRVRREASKRSYSARMCTGVINISINKR